MSCCCPHSVSGARLFSRHASRYRKRFDRKGLEKSQRQLSDQLIGNGIDGATLLEIGCGVGYFHQQLLHQGANRATGIDLSEDMINQARQWAGEQGFSDRTHYLTGDIMFLDEPVESADIVILDKVICCYPDARGLVNRAADLSRKVIAFTIPRSTWYMAFGIAVGGLYMCLRRSDFRPYLHDPGEIHDWLGKCGFKLEHQDHTLAWLSRTYRRQ